MTKTDEKILKELVKEGYGIVGENCAVKICQWTRNSLNSRGVCWKEKFYGIESHRCAQITTSLFNCDNKCLHCWRNLKYSKKGKVKNAGSASEILDSLIKERKRLLIGFQGNKKIPQKKLQEALNPNLFTFSLSGESTLDSNLGEMIKEIRRRNSISFLVTNGLHPDALKKLESDGNLPTQITVSTNVPCEKMFSLWHNNYEDDAWDRFNETLKLLRKLKGKVRRVIRLTLVREGKTDSKFKELCNMKDSHVLQYCELIRKAEPDFVHIKGFKSVGFSRERLGYDKQPWHYDIKKFAEKIAEELEKEGYKILGEEKRSCVVVLGKDRKSMKIRKEDV